MTGRLTAALVLPARCATLVSQVAPRSNGRRDDLQFTRALPLSNTRLVMLIAARKGLVFSKKALSACRHHEGEPAFPR